MGAGSVSGLISSVFDPNNSVTMNSVSSIPGASTFGNLDPALVNLNNSYAMQSVAADPLAVSDPSNTIAQGDTQGMGANNIDAQVNNSELNNLSDLVKSLMNNQGGGLQGMLGSGRTAS